MGRGLLGSRWGGGGGMVRVLSGRGWWRVWGGRDSAIEGEVHFQRGGSGGGWGEERDGEMYLFVVFK